MGPADVAVQVRRLAASGAQLETIVVRIRDGTAVGTQHDIPMMRRAGRASMIGTEGAAPVHARLYRFQFDGKAHQGDGAPQRAWPGRSLVVGLLAIAIGAAGTAALRGVFGSARPVRVPGSQFSAARPRPPYVEDEAILFGSPTCARVPFRD